MDPSRKVRLVMVYPPSAGRSFDEILWVIDSLQTSDRHEVGTLVNWRPGEPVIVLSSVSDEEARARVPQGFTAERPYLRWVDLPRDAG